jgi:hypothetical protein
MSLHEIQSHQARLDGLRLMLSPAPAVCNANGFIERLVLELEDPAIVLKIYRRAWPRSKSLSVKAKVRLPRFTSIAASNWRRAK